MSSFIGFAIVVAAAASTGARFKPDAWYQGLKKPGWTPPNAIFGPVWTVLYIAIAFAGWLVWRDVGSQWNTALTFWVLQIVINAAWSWLYFGRHNIGAAFADCLLLLVTVIAFAFAAAPINGVAAMLFMPYALWVAFASALNGAIWWMNRSEYKTSPAGS